ncbi:MAG: hypothetical protein E6K18_07425, partial [Methanobacteriota archaeon]
MKGTEPIRNRLLRGGYFALWGTVVSSVGSLTTSVILARLLGSEGLGVWTIFSILGTVIIPLLSLSIPSAVTKYTSELRTRSPDRLVVLLASSLAVLLVVGVFGTLFTILLVAPGAGRLYGEPVLVSMLMIMGLAFLGNFLALFGSAVLAGFEEFQTSNLVGAVGMLSTAVLLLLFI